MFRKLQLLTINCGRENTEQACQSARVMADPLMDHPRLPAACKDTIWAIRERSVPAATNSFERREQLNRFGSDLMALCKPAAKPVGTSAQPSQDGEKKSGGLGGFLKGLGIGGNTNKP